MKIMIGICTYNREKVVKDSFESLKRVKQFNELDVHVFDDCSTEYGVDFLQEMLPEARITRRERNLGPDMNTLRMFSDFLNTDNDILIICDSDLIYGEQIVSVVKEKMNEAEFFSVFNAVSSHPPINSRDDDFVEKERVGAAGCCMSRRVVDIITSNLKSIECCIDNDFCQILKEHGFKRLALKKSQVQHIGCQGFNSFKKAFDYGVNFTVDSLENAKVLEQLAEEVITYDPDAIECELRRRIDDVVRGYENSISWKITAPLRKIKKIVRAIRLNTSST